MKLTWTTALRRARLSALAASLPGVEVSGERHLRFAVRQRTFGYYQINHHADGVVALVVKAPPGVLGHLVRSAPDRFFQPADLGARGWVGFRLDGRSVDWGEVEGLLRTAHALVAPRRFRTA
jgi:hypothetical protein